MTAVPIPQSSGLRLDQATVVSAAAVLALMSVMFAALGALPQHLAFIGDVGEVFAPLLCVPVFSRFREVLVARRAVIGAPIRLEPAGYRFSSYALVGSLLLMALGALFNSISILQKSAVIEMLREGGTVLTEGAMRLDDYGDGILVLPLVAVASAVIGWIIHKNRVPHPMLCIVTIAILTGILRGLYMWLAIDFLPVVAAEGQKVGLSPGLALAVAFGTWPVMILTGSAAGFAARALCLLVARHAKTCFERIRIASTLRSSEEPITAGPVTPPETTNRPSLRGETEPDG